MKTGVHHHPSHANHVSQTEVIVKLVAMPAVAEQPKSKRDRSRLIQIRAYEVSEHATGPSGDQFWERYGCEAERTLGLSPERMA